MTTLSIVLWVVLPYLAFTIFIVGLVLRYRYDQFGWTSRSSQVYESRLLRWGSPMFHIGVLMVIAGHIVGLLIPREWLYAIGISEHIYHIGATWLGTFAALLTLAGMAILVYRRVRVDAVRIATSAMDVVMYIVLAATLLFGTIATVMYQVFGPAYEYRGSISPWLRSLLGFQPQPELMAQTPVMFQIHILCALMLFAIWPFTRLVHVFSAPIGYFFRPYLVYRSRDQHRGSRQQRRGWGASALPGKHNQSEKMRGRP